MLFEFTKYGSQKSAGANYKSIMPTYEGKLTDEEIWLVLAFIKSKWTDEIQKKHTKAFSQ
jgi:mono/diheme cytochrome c family protein